MRTTDLHNLLKTYRDKRHFDATPEPELERKRNKSDAITQHLFVVQKHAARHLHYDFRLELGGTLKSWAVPKGPSLDPAIKRMAIHVEDHPLSYADFEGTIPAGNYGAGTVIVWDIGTWQTNDDAQASYEKGHLRFELHGEKLRGHWHLVRTRGRSGDKESWLLIKQQDEQARPAAQYDIVAAQPDSVLRTPDNSPHTPKKQPRARTKPETTVNSTANVPGTPAEQPLMLAPQLATLVDTAPSESGWLYEVKFDGYRLLARINAQDEVHLFTRNGNDWTKKLKPLANALDLQGFESAWLDGEIIAPDANGISNFQKLQNAFEQGKTNHIVYMLFDILFYRGNDLRSLPLQQRRQLLKTLLNNSDSHLLRFSDHIDARHDDLLEIACRMRVEGLIGKRVDSRYTSGRTRDWIKLKCLQRQEFVIGGYTDASNNNVRAIGALLLGVNDDQGHLRYAGKVGTGFTQQSAIELHRKLTSLQTAKSPFAETIRQPNVHWVKPSLLAEVAFSAWTDDGRIRHSAFQGLRTDKAAVAITREMPMPIHETTHKGKSTTGRVAVAGVDISHPDRVIDKTSGTTKLELARYYERIASQLLAQLKDRPVSLVRAPEGVGGEIFFQKHRGSLPITEITELDPALMPDHPPLIAINTTTALIQCVQMNVVEFHTWNARVAHSEQPDRMVFDLDPGEGIVWSQIVAAAQLLKSMLDELHLKSYLKTSGGKGLHVVVPLAPRDDWPRVRDFSEALVRHLADTLPQLFVATSGPKNRIKRIYIDYLRNNRGSTTAAAFSARLRPGLGVSMPLAFDELTTIESSGHWHVGNVDAHVAADRIRCWDGYNRVKQTLTRAYKLLDMN